MATFIIRIGLISSVLLFAGLVATYFEKSQQCATHKKELYSTCFSSVPKVVFGTMENAPEFKDSVQVDGLPTMLRRVSDNSYFNLKNGAAVHSYSRRQAWNSDESLLYIGGKIIDANSLEILVDMLPVSSESVWSNTEPSILYGLRFNEDILNQFVRYDIQTEEIEVLIDLVGKANCTIGRGEGSQSNDDSRVLFVCGDTEGKSQLISFEMQAKRVTAELELTEFVDWAGFSQSGRHIVVESASVSGGNRSLIRYTPELTDPTVLTDKRHHGDFGLDENGDDVFAMIGDVGMSYIRLRDGVRIELPITTRTNKIMHGHLSCRNIHRPGWCYISSYSNIVGAVKITESRGISGFLGKLIGKAYGIALFEHWGFHESSSDTYQAQPKVSASPSGRQLIFTSDWNGNQETNDFVLSVVSSEQ